MIDRIVNATSKGYGANVNVAFTAMLRLQISVIDLRRLALTFGAKVTKSSAEVTRITPAGDTLLGVSEIAIKRQHMYFSSEAQSQWPVVVSRYCELGKTTKCGPTWSAIVLIWRCTGCRILRSICSSKGCVLATDVAITHASRHKLRSRKLSSSFLHEVERAVVARRHEGLVVTQTLSIS